MLDWMKSIPTLLAYYVPGYLAYHIFTRLTGLMTEDGHKPEGSSLIPSIIISYFTTSITALSMHIQPIDSELETSLVLHIALISALIAMLLSLLFSFIWQTKWFQGVFEDITGTSVNHSVWPDVLEYYEKKKNNTDETNSTDETNEKSEKKSLLKKFKHKKVRNHIRVFTEFQHRKANVEGDVAYYEVDKNGDCLMALVKCTVVYENNDIYEPKGMLIFKTKDVNIVETVIDTEKMRKDR